MQLDDKARSRLRALADATRGELDEAASARIASQVARSGPRVLRRARMQRTGMQIGVVLAVLGAIGWRVLVPADVAQPVAQHAPQPSAPLAAAAQPARACEGREAPEPRWTFAGGNARVELGSAGTVAVEAGAQMWVDASERCRLRLRLLAGRLRVHAADLGGGELRVVTPSGDVVVHGTTFGVTHDDASLIVDVDEGRVAVQARGEHVPHMVGSGERLRAEHGRAVQIEPLPASERDAMHAALAAVPAPAPAAAPTVPHPPAHATEPRVASGSHATPAPSAASLVTEADALWLHGEHDRARARYREAGALSGATAEAAWLALARRELSDAAPAAARAALQQYRVHFAHGTLAAEADGIAFRAALQEHDLPEAQRVAERLVHSAPGTAQAEAAARWLKSQAPR